MDNIEDTQEYQDLIRRSDRFKNMIDARIAQVEEGESLGRGVVQGGTLGFGDELYGAGKAVIEKLSGNDEKLAAIYERARDQVRRNNEIAKLAHPNYYTGGEIGGGVATAFIPGLGIAKGAKLLQAAKTGAILGGISGLGHAEGTAQQQAEETAKGAVIGGGVGAAGYGLGKAIESGGVGASRAQAALQELAEKGKYAAGRSALGTAINKLPAAEQENAINFAIDEGIMNPLKGTKGMANKATETVENAWKSEVRGTPQLSQETATQVRNALQDKLNKPLTEGSGGLGTLGTAIGFATGHPLIGGAGGVAAKVGMNVLKNRGPQITAVGLDKIAKILQTNPNALGKWAQPLASALQRGNHSLSVTNFILQQTEPEYRTLVQGLTGKEDDQEDSSENDDNYERLKEDIRDLPGFRDPTKIQF